MSLEKGTANGEHRCCVPLELGEELVWRKVGGERSGNMNRCVHSSWARAGAVVSFALCFVGRVLSVSELPVFHFSNPII